VRERPRAGLRHRVHPTCQAVLGAENSFSPPSLFSRIQRGAVSKVFRQRRDHALGVESSQCPDCGSRILRSRKGSFFLMHSHGLLNGLNRVDLRLPGNMPGDHFDAPVIDACWDPWRRTRARLGFRSNPHGGEALIYLSDSMRTQPHLRMLSLNDRPR
jgi:hypothetical protein